MSTELLCLRCRSTETYRSRGVVSECEVINQNPPGGADILPFVGPGPSSATAVVGETKRPNGSVFPGCVDSIFNVLTTAQLGF